MASARFRSLLPQLLDRVKLLKPISDSRLIHEDTMCISMDVAGYWEYSRPSNLNWRSRILPQASIVGNSSPLTTCALCYQVLQKQKDIKTLYSHKDFILSNMGQFNVDEILLLCYTLASHVTPYSIWFRVNCNDLTVLLMGCHRYLMESIKRMTVEQLHSTLVMCHVLCSRYPVFGLDYNPLQLRVMDRLSELLSTDVVIPKQRLTPRKVESSDSSVGQLPTKIQCLYRRIYPYFEAVNGRFSVGRSNVYNLIGAAAMIQRQHSRMESFPLNDFNTLCSDLKRLLSNPDAFSLQSLLNMVILLHGNVQVSPKVVQLEREEVHALALKLKDLAIDSYIVLPGSDGEPLVPDDVEQYITKLLSSTLESPSLYSLAASLTALKDSTMLNHHLIMLFMPYIASGFRNIHKESHNMLDLILPISTLGMQGFPFWVVYFSVIKKAISTTTKHDYESLTQLCKFLSDCLRILCQEMSAEPFFLQPIDEERSHPKLSEDIATDKHVDTPTTTNDRYEKEMQDLRWLGHLDDIFLVNVTDFDNMETTPSLPTLLKRRFGLHTCYSGLIDTMVASVHDLESSIADVIMQIEDPKLTTCSEKLSHTLVDGSHGMQSVKTFHDGDSWESSSLDDRLPTLNRELRALELYTSIFERLVKNAV